MRTRNIICLKEPIKSENKKYNSFEIKQLNKYTRSLLDLSSVRGEIHILTDSVIIWFQYMEVWAVLDLW